jgi:hypothetical protein
MQMSESDWIFEELGSGIKALIERFIEVRISSIQESLEGKTQKL